MVWEGQKQCHDTTLRSQNAEQLRENGWLRCTVGVNHNHLKHMIARSAIPLQRHNGLVLDVIDWSAPLLGACVALGLNEADGSLTTASSTA